jgi:hypothetical protein
MLRKLLRKTKNFVLMPLSSKFLFAEAIFTSAYVKILLLFFPFRRVTPWLGTVQTQNTVPPLSGKLDLVNKIKTAIKLCDKYTPWPTECYTRSLTAKIMLKRRKLGSVLYFGFRRDEQGGLKGHSWLQCSGTVVTGFCDFSKYQIHSSFS